MCETKLSGASDAAVVYSDIPGQTRGHAASDHSPSATPSFGAVGGPPSAYYEPGRTAAATATALRVALRAARGDTTVGGETTGAHAATPRAASPSLRSQTPVT